MANLPVPHSVTQMKNRVGAVYLLISMVAVAAVGGLAAAPNAEAVGTWAAISWSPAQGVSGTGDGVTEAEAVGKASSGCTGNGGTECRTVISAENACIAVAAYVLTYAGGKGPTLDAARSDALAQLGNATVKQAMCGGNPGAKTPPAQGGPGIPTGPRLAFTPGLGSLTVHITDLLGTESTCTYKADWYRSLPFRLPANGTFDLLIVPYVPENRLRNVEVVCDNGAINRSQHRY